MSRNSNTVIYTGLDVIRALTELEKEKFTVEFREGITIDFLELLFHGWELRVKYNPRSIQYGFISTPLKFTFTNTKTNESFSIYSKGKTFVNVHDCRACMLEFINNNTYKIDNISFKKSTFINCDENYTDVTTKSSIQQYSDEELLNELTSRSMEKTKSQNEKFRQLEMLETRKSNNIVNLIEYIQEKIKLMKTG